MSEIEEAIRRQMVAEREQARQAPEQDTYFGNDAFVEPGAAPPPKPSTLHNWKSQGGLLGGLATILLLLAKVGGPLLALLSKIKLLAFLKVFLVTGGSMLISMWFWGVSYGWSFGVGIVVLIFIHECGHAIAGKALGHPIGPMVFIPLMGAFVSIRKSRNIVEDAHIGIMGPVFGTIAGIGCLVIYQLTQNLFWVALAHVNFFINLFNLLPMPPLDGSWITPLFSPKLLALGVILLFIVAPANPMIWILGVMSLPRIIGGWKAKPTDRYYQASAAARWKYGIAYIGLAAFLGYGYLVLHEELSHRFSTGQQVAMRVDPSKRS